MSHFQPVPTLLKELKTSEQGLTTKEALTRLEIERNELPAAPKTSLFDQIKQQFQDTLVLILLASAIVSFLLSIVEGFNVEPFVILLILILNAIVAIQQESNAEQAIEALQEYYSDETKCFRDGQLQVVLSKELVKGDVIQLVVGDKVPADCRILKIITSEFKCDQSILTGETNSVNKQVCQVKDKQAVVQEMENMVFSGTCVTIGKAICLVTDVGVNTNIGKIHSTITSAEEERSPLKIQLDEFGDELAKVITVVCILVWAINVRHFNDPSHGGLLKGMIYYFKIAVALAVAAIPEGLAVIITTCLALGTQQMAKQGAIVRKLKSVETLGCCSIICSDKTGTLTTNQMSVRKAYVFAANDEYEVDGNTYGPEGSLWFAGKKQKFGQVLSGQEMKTLVEICSTCNESQVVYDEHSDSFQRIGEPTEAALFSFVEKVGTVDPVFNSLLNNNAVTKQEKHDRCGKVNQFYAGLYRKDCVLEFSRDRKSMSTVVTDIKTNKQVMHCKGAPESIIERSSTVLMQGKVVEFTARLKKAIMEKATMWGEENAYRVLALAYKPDPQLPSRLVTADYANYETSLTFVGLVAMADPPRPEVKDSILLCKKAGIRVVVITGDHQKTAESICRQIGLLDGSSNNKSYTGKQFEHLSDIEKLECLNRAVVFSRTEPAHKSMLVDLYKSMGYIVAMTGDGVNDAPALKKADIGVAMGTGTDVAKMASEIVLQDDNFATIVSSVKQGRSIYANTKQFIRYLISSNIGEVVS